MYYIGSHYGSVDDSYICSSKWMLDAYKKRPQDFKMRIMKYVETDDLKLLQQYEQYYLDMIKESELSTSINVMLGANRYYNMKKYAIGGCSKGHAKNRTKPAWNKGVTAEMIMLRRQELFCLFCDKPKPQPDISRKLSESLKGRVPWNKGKKSTKPAWNKGKKSTTPAWNKGKKSTKPAWNKGKRTMHTKICTCCGIEFTTEIRNRQCCSRSCANSLNAKKGSRAENGRKSAKIVSERVTGRKRLYASDGTWTWFFPNR